MSSSYFLSIVIPAYKEENRINGILDAIIKYEKNKPFPIEIIVVIDASPDDTLGVVRSYQNKLKNLKIIEGKVNKGKGGAIRDGILSAKGKYILFADADNSTPIEQVDKLLKYIEKYEVVIGSRYCKGGKLNIPQSLIRRAGGRFVNFAIRALAVRGIKDTQCGFKLFQREAATRIFSRQTIFRFSFDVEILAIACYLGYKIKEVGIDWYDMPHSTLHPIRDGFAMIRDSFYVRRRLILGFYRNRP